ncbi:uncharacterized protein M421DRAFT_395990 [Didymella exigua CBS 183.55]|uniref:PH domain-containing protein n=1 Tax=Didymella exigua CBS 183.55 TaxID=1150837 RepID=A0A6A5RZ87_9PLEO|nr:uncharacterized protein M421DRAFT_395990 [Didymella exigua CBS 183.55]KAF1933775.1 hypothetical protein M421DRAFT_395990 [Didymella exigua CBS 183.55]
METVSAVFGIMAALPQCIQSAKELYDLRERYKDASVLITAIYSESMVIAASLSQVQNLLQHDALLQKPQLLETFDRALTGCRVVYGCLEEEVRDLVEKAQRNELKFRDRATYLLKEDTFKELLTQIRGQQSALSLLIQGLQMESMADMRKLVEANSSKLDQIVKRSKTLRQTHPRIKVPDSIFSYESGVADASDAESIVKSTHFEFDDQVISSKAYQRAMARYTMDTADRDVLPYMPRITSTAPYLTQVRADAFDTIETKIDNKSARVPLRSFSEGPPIVPDATPPLPPRRTSGPQLRSQDSAATLKARSKSSDGSLNTSEAGSILSQGEPSCFESGEMHAIWLSLVEAERNFFDRMTRLRRMFYDNVIRQWPLLEPHLGIVLIGEQLAGTNKKFLWLPMEQQLSESDQATCDPAIFATWTENVQRMFREYCQALPHAIGALRATQINDGNFAPFVNTLGLSIAYFGKSWEDYLRLPVTELDICIESIRSLVSIANDLEQPGADVETQRLTSSLNALDWLKSSSASVLEQSQGREDMQNLERRIHTLDTDILSQLSLLDTKRRVRYQGSMTMKLKSKGPWHAVHVALLDNYLLWGKIKAQRKTAGEKVIVLDAPIPISELEVSLPCDQHQFQKATMFDEVPRNSIQYMIMIKRKDSDGKAHLLGSPTYQDRRTWMDHFELATEKR